MRVGIIVPYFGKLPNYFQSFLDSCSWNPEYDWIIFTDDKAKYMYPPNVRRVGMDFPSCRTRIQSKFDFKITLPSPQKLCDYKCAYGMIFEDYLQNYDWWGYCDLDQIFGSLSNFINEDMLQKYDKLFSLGHLTLYRNTSENNRVFMQKLNEKARYQEVFTTEHGCAFDEWLPGNVNEIYIQSGKNIQLHNIGADVNPYKTAFTLVDYDIDNRCYKTSPIKNSIFKWDKGKLYQLYMDGKKLQTQEYPYVHLQKRAMVEKRINKAASSFYIVPNRFVDGNMDSVKLLASCKKWTYLNPQFFKVKWKSLKYRLKSGDWRFNSVFSKSKK